MWKIYGAYIYSFIFNIAVVYLMIVSSDHSDLVIIILQPKSDFSRDIEDK